MVLIVATVYQRNGRQHYRWRRFSAMFMMHIKFQESAITGIWNIGMGDIFMNMRINSGSSLGIKQLYCVFCASFLREYVTALSTRIYPQNQEEYRSSIRSL